MRKLIILPGLLTGCAQVPAPVPNLDVVEAAFRYEFQHNESSSQSNVSAYCIRIVRDADGKLDDTPPPELIVRLSDVVPTVKTQSACEPVEHGRYGVIARSTGRSPLLFSVGIPKCCNASACEVEGGYYEASLSASSNTYYLEKHDGKWVVVRNVENWIS